MCALYHPLDGRELLKWILHELKENLPQHYVFSQAMAYHNPTFILKLQITSWSPENTTKYPVGDTTVEATGSKITSKDPQGPQGVPQGGELRSQDVNVNFTEPLYSPDKARDAAQLGRYETEKVAGVLVDVKKDTNRPAEVPQKS